MDYMAPTHATDNNNVDALLVIDEKQRDVVDYEKLRIAIREALESNSNNVHKKQPVADKEAGKGTNDGQAAVGVSDEERGILCSSCGSSVCQNDYYFHFSRCGGGGSGGRLLHR